jgi:hypothetical protein
LRSRLDSREECGTRGCENGPLLPTHIARFASSHTTRCGTRSCTSLTALSLSLTLHRSTGGILRNAIAAAAANLPRPKLTTIWAAGLSFSKCHAELATPYDPNLPEVFDGEEISKGELIPFPDPPRPTDCFHCTPAGVRRWSTSLPQCAACIMCRIAERAADSAWACRDTSVAASPAVMVHARVEQSTAMKRSSEFGIS